MGVIRPTVAEPDSTGSGRSPYGARVVIAEDGTMAHRPRRSLRWLRRTALAAALLTLPALLAPAPAGAQGKKTEAILLEGELERARLKKVLEQGPQKFIASLRLAPHMNGKRFVGFRIDGFAPDSPLVNGGAVQPGDVVLRVNREPVERPDQFMRAWEVVGGADTLEVELLRGTQRYLYRYTLI